MTREPIQDRFGRLAFAYCKIATVSLLLGRFALPVAASLSSGLFIAGWIKGKKDTKCYLREPLVAAGFWIVIVLLWLWAELEPSTFPHWLLWIHR